MHRVPTQRPSVRAFLMLDRGTRCLARLSLVALCLSASRCSSPTEPESAFISFEGTIENVSGAATLVSIGVYVDGKPTAPNRTGEPRSSSSLIGICGSPTTRGPHTLEIRIEDQVGSPNLYRVYGVGVTFSKIGSTLAQIKLADTTQSVSTGESIIYRFTL
jgi:hypothetical protein